MQRRPFGKLRVVGAKKTGLIPVVLAVFVAACHPTARPAAPSKPAASLQQQIDALLDSPELAHGFWGVLVKSLTTGDTLYARDAGKLFLPASNMKILTTAVTASRLGWDFAYETRLVAAGPIEAGVLHGDLVVVGSGDPSVTSIGAGSNFDDFAARLRALGLRRIDGRIVGDDHRFTDDRLGFGWSWTDLADDYSAGVSALQVDEDVVRVTLAPGREVGSVAAIAAAPPYTSIKSSVITGAAGSTADVESRRLGDTRPILLRGTVPLGGEPVTLALAVERPTTFFVTRLRAALIANGIDVGGAAVDLDEITTPVSRDTRVLLTHRSAPLSTLAVRLMKVSQNLYADTFLKTVGAAAGNPTWDGGRAAVRETLTAWGVPASDAFVADGSGLSRYNFVTPGAIVQVLTHVYNDASLRDRFVATMPVAGRDGSLSSRMKGTAAEGNVKAKTGSMTRVRAVSGYVTTADGEPLAFSILANNFDAAPDVITKTADAIMVTLAETCR